MQNKLNKKYKKTKCIYWKTRLYNTETYYIRIKIPTYNDIIYLLKQSKHPKTHHNMIISID